MCSIAILLATYNSEKFLKAQLDSLFSQIYRDFILYIRDDGSTDATLQIIHEYTLHYANIQVLEDTVKGRKPIGSFMWLLEHTEADYYMFCDHDDVWLPDKIGLTLNEMKKCEIGNLFKPVIINTDLQVVDTHLNVIHPSFWKYSKINRKILSDFNYLCVCNCFTGCTMMINKNAKHISFPISEKALMHDYWIALKVSAEGGILGFIPQATMLYRQHEMNVVGALEVGEGYVANKLKSIRSVFQANKKNLKMIRAIKSYSIIKYLYYKFLYFNVR